MIHHDDQLKLQAYLDGELAAREAAEVLALLAASAEARQLLAELQFTAAALTGPEADLKHPEPHDFFWSKIRREIQRQEPPAPAPKMSWADWLTRRFAPVGALAVLAISLILLFAHSEQSLPKQFGGMELASAGETELASGDMDMDTYSDQQEKTDYVWLQEHEDSPSASATPVDGTQQQ